MTENEAIELIEKDLKLHSKDLSSKYKNGLRMAIQTLEKQIPKKPLHNGANWYRCPNGCEVHKKTFEKDWHCPKCGQKLDWQ